jgi:alkanesulfonate monooxygenase SsuD/methylene tetrahydromethanopterin reductase-like flavin-dependent oxidoreductase (luciferase family)
MAAFAASTSRLRLGQMCTCMSYRNPMYLAKVAATVDLISGGRAEMGIGAGWYEHEWLAYGYGFPSAGERLAMLDEGVQIMRRAWQDGVATFEGKHYTVDGAICRPLPLQPGGPPLWIAGGGEKKTLRIAAEHAAYTNYAGDPETFEHKSGVLDGHCRDLGRDPAEIVRSANYNVVIGRDEAEVRERLAAHQERRRPHLSADALERDGRTLDSGLLVGTPEQLVERLRRMDALGLGYVICYFGEAAYDRSGIDLFAQQVIPELA